MYLLTMDARKKKHVQCVMGKAAIPRCIDGLIVLQWEITGFLNCGLLLLGTILELFDEMMAYVIN